MSEIEILRAECNDCEWKGYEYDLIQDSSDDAPTCPDCGSDDIYLLKEEEGLKK